MMAYKLMYDVIASTRQLFAGEDAGEPADRKKRLPCQNFSYNHYVSDVMCNQTFLHCVYHHMAMQTGLALTSLLVAFEAS